MKIKEEHRRLLQKYRENRYCRYTRPVSEYGINSSGYPAVFDFKEYGTPRGVSHCGWIPDKNLGNDEYRLLQEPHRIKSVLICVI